MKVLVAQSCPTLCKSMDCSLPGSSVHEILQTRTLEWIAIPFSNGSNKLKKKNHLHLLLRANCFNKIGYSLLNFVHTCVHMQTYI